MDEDWWQAAAAQAGSDILGSVVNNLWYQKNLDKQQVANQKMADYMYTKDLEQWNRANAYNAPAAQMERLKSAGLNPNLVYGPGKATGNTSMPGPKQSPALRGVANPNFQAPNVLGMYQDYQMNQANVDNTNAQKNYTDARTTHEMTRNAIALIDQKQRDLNLSRDRYKWLGGYRYRTDRKGNIIGEDYYKGDRYYHSGMQDYRRDAERWNLSMEYQKRKLIEQQIDQAKIRNKIYQKDLNWYNWKHGVNLGAKTAATAAGSFFGFSRAGKMLKNAPGGSAYKPKYNLQGTRPRYQRYNPNKGMSPNYGF